MAAGKNKGELFLRLYNASTIPSEPPYSKKYHLPIAKVEVATAMHSTKHDLKQIPADCSFMLQHSEFHGAPCKAPVGYLSLWARSKILQPAINTLK